MGPWLVPEAPTLVPRRLADFTGPPPVAGFESRARKPWRLRLLRHHAETVDSTSVALSTPLRSELPTGATLLALEQQVRHGGTGLGPAELAGCWQLDQVWPKGSSRASSFSGLLLRGLGARLEIEAAGDALHLSNAVKLGAVELRFRGPGRLLGSRPLLEFWFERLELRLAGRLVLQRSLPAPAPRRMPFFALIARDPAGWLAARGRGGGLALWRLQNPQQLTATTGRSDQN